MYYMQVVVLASEAQKAELSLKSISKNVTIFYINEYEELGAHKNTDVYFFLKEEINFDKINSIEQPVFINDITNILNHFNWRDNVSRINGWPTFLQRNIWEMATKNGMAVKKIFDAISWKYITVPDEPGFIAARIIAMIINEAYFTYEEKISTKDEIDTAMKLGTNYPFGPFEWAEKIGLQKVYNLLKALEKTNSRYTIAAALKKELF